LAPGVWKKDGEKKGEKGGEISIAGRGVENATGVHTRSGERLPYNRGPHVRCLSKKERHDCDGIRKKREYSAKHRRKNGKPGKNHKHTPSCKARHSKEKKGGE